MTVVSTTMAVAGVVEHGRVPSAEERRDLRERWIDDEVFYREALALGFDRRDGVAWASPIWWEADAARPPNP